MTDYNDEFDTNDDWDFVSCWWEYLKNLADGDALEPQVFKAMNDEFEKLKKENEELKEEKNKWKEIALRHWSNDTLGSDIDVSDMKCSNEWNKNLNFVNFVGCAGGKYNRESFTKKCMDA